ncbi:MAG: hypothetical protein B6D70_07715 [gamma proteobacterium symbiont of Stewartia floridana]|nr:hypothetical protein [Candidatus Thiodiazotropha taylori]RLW53974.1 MAG: hypothetical protein B6D76_09820 [gamma proteobacterium symbiont of Stewartia floridana]MCG7918218.1 hypothetical protein [Candidatus Thiodiazotropha taylori]MCG8100486.1 hypothetical protein [Candidatus Thiodiazotropha taylori]MCW4244905.1 hypothetical protein [Candidatus Thiodiazotropha taylori]
MTLKNEDLLGRLLQLAQDLYAETAELSETESELQLWYNRGYADGMTRQIRDLGYAGQVAEVLGSVAESISEEQQFLPWGKAYRHGFEVGERETIEVLGEKNG